MRRAAGMIATTVPLAFALTHCLVGFEDYPVRDPDGGTDASGSGGSWAGGSGWTSSGGAGGSGGTAGAGGVGGASGSAGASGTGGASGASGVGGAGGALIDCTQYVWGLLGGSCYAYASGTAASIEGCTGPGAAFLTCDVKCINANGNTCVQGASVSSVTIDGMCIIQAQTPFCTATCNTVTNESDYGQCDTIGSCVISPASCGNYLCDVSTGNCRTSCIGEDDCVATASCLVGICTPDT